MSNFDFDPLTCDPTLFCAKNSKKGKKKGKRVESNPIFPKKGRGEELWF